MKVSRRHGRPRMRLEAVEVELLRSLLDQLEALLDGAGDGADDIRHRLAPAAYPDDREAEAEFRTLTASALRTERDERIEACRAELARSADVDLATPEAGRRWLQVLNDLRLTLGTRLGITEDDQADFDDSPEDQLRAVYDWLTAVQDSVVTELMR